jgi:hypothetical protein
MQKKVSIAWLLGEILCRYLISPFGLMCEVALKFLCWSFPWMTYLLVNGGVFSFPTITGLRSICALMSISFFFNVDECPYVWCIYVKNWYFLMMNCFFNIKWPSFSLFECPYVWCIYVKNWYFLMMILILVWSLLCQIWV